MRPKTHRFLAPRGMKDEMQEDSAVFTNIFHFLKQNVERHCVYIFFEENRMLLCMFIHGNDRVNEIGG